MKAVGWWDGRGVEWPAGELQETLADHTHADHNQHDRTNILYDVPLPHNFTFARLAHLARLARLARFLAT